MTFLLKEVALCGLLVLKEGETQGSWCGQTKSCWTTDTIDTINSRYSMIKTQSTTQMLEKRKELRKGKRREGGEEE